jgi:hypothetical protein
LGGGIPTEFHCCETQEFGIGIGVRKYEPTEGVIF